LTSATPRTNAPRRLRHGCSLTALVADGDRTALLEAIRAPTHIIHCGPIRRCPWPHPTTWQANRWHYAGSHSRHEPDFPGPLVGPFAWDIASAVICD
jgi:hypothetical protein